MLSIFCLLGCLALRQDEPVKDEPVKAFVRMDQPSQHFYQVELSFPGGPAGERRLKMATWTPGSYKIRDFAKNVEGFGAFDTEDKPLAWHKLDKTTWAIDAPADIPIKVRYSVFAYTFSVRTSYLDDQQGFINPASVFFYEDGRLERPIEVVIHPPEGWAAASALPKIGIYHFRAENFDHLVDAPFQFGRFRRHEFQVRDIPHYWLIAGDVNLNEPEMVNSLKAIGETVGDLFGAFPFENYYIFSQFRLDGAGGGLEHKNSTMVQGHAGKLRTQKGWNNFLGLIIHEYFHAWNVKAIHDEALSQFNYGDENYTQLLWLHEGWTSYYDTLLMGRAGFYDAKDLRKAFAKEVKRYLEKPGTSHQSLRDASFNAWIHQYQPSATSHNSRVSYYSEGAMSGLALDLLIRHESNGEKSLDDVMRSLYQNYARQDRGINWDVVVGVVNDHAGTIGVDFLNTYIAAPNPLPLEMFLEYAGLELMWFDDDDNDGIPDKEKGPYAPNPSVWMGVSFNKKDGIVFVDKVIRKGTGWRAGLDFGDEVLAVNQRRVNAGNLDQILGWSRPGDEVTVLLNRAGRILTLPVKLEARPKKLRLVRRENPGTLDTRIYRDMFGEDKDKQEEDTPETSNPSE